MLGNQVIEPPFFGDEETKEHRDSGTSNKIETIWFGIAIIAIR